jgi:hypothetical protein
MSRLLCFFGKHEWIDEDDLPSDGEQRLVNHRRICAACKKRRLVKVMSRYRTEESYGLKPNSLRGQPTE